jgi:methyltransferase family protein
MIANALRYLSDYRNPDSLAARLRRRRFAHFLSLLDRISTPFTLLDVGGSPTYWRKHDFPNRPGVRVIVLNLGATERCEPPFEIVNGDACDLSRYANHSIDVVYSNSVIEHVADHALMASEVRRVARRYYVQTPNFWFPIEPHFLIPGFQWLPMAMRAALIRRIRLGHAPTVQTRDEARQLVESVRLLSRRELKSLFPGASIHAERVAGLPKSWLAFDGW